MAAHALHDHAADLTAIGHIAAIPTILDTVCRHTGMGFAAVARVTEDRWIACSVKDDIAFGLQPGGELEVATTLCHEIRQSGSAVVISHVAQDAVYCGHPTPARYGFQSYISVPIVLPDGGFFGTLCAIDPAPAPLDGPETIGMFTMFADLIGFHIQAQRQMAAGQQAERSAEMVTSILAATPDCIMVLSAAGELEYMNARGVELNQFGSVQDVLGQEFAALWPEAERGKIRVAVQRAAHGQIARTQGFCPTARGEPRWWEVSFAPLRPGGGAPKVVGISRDATDRRHAEVALRASQARLRESEQRLDALVRSSSEVRFSMSADWRELYQLAGGGFIPDTTSANPDWLQQYIPQGHRAAVRQEYERAIRTRSTYHIEHQVHRVDGTVGWALSRAVPLMDAEDRITGWLGAASDVSDRKRAEAALRGLNATLEQQVAERTAELNRLWQNSLDLLAIVETDGTFIAINAAWTSLLGWTSDELVNTPFAPLVHPDDLEATQAVFAGLFDAPLTQPYTYRLRHRDGSYRWVAWIAVLEQGKIYANGRDVTAERTQAAALAAAEDALRHAQKMEAIGQLTGGVAHDFNNLLTVIKSSTELLKRPSLPEERRSRYITAISNTVDRAAKLTSQLLAFARRQALKPEVFAVCDAVRTIGDMIRTLTGSRIQIVSHLPEVQCFVSADASQFDTALVNMAINARDAMDGAGTLTIRVQPVDRIPADRLHPQVAGAFVAVSIADTGSGISPQALEHIFEPFFTTKGVGHGTGLGLSQVFGFAKQSGGEVHVSSVPGQGSTFTLYLPRVQPPVDAPAAREGEDEPLVDGHGTCVLVVEDNTDVGTFTMQTLQELGYQTVWASDGRQALAELAQGADRFDVVFSDVVMPGMNGIELAQRIRRDHHDLPVVLTTGYSHVLAQDGSHGFELLRKPYSVEQLSRVLRKAITWQRRQRILAGQFGRQR